jgi:hypothetical protein
MSFREYKKNRTKVNEVIDKKIDELDANPFQDDRFWELSVDKAGNGSAVIRLLPGKEGEDIPFAQIWEHKFQGPGGWYMEMCLTTPRIDGKARGGQDPVCEDNRELWNSGVPDNKTIVSGDPNNNIPGRKRRLSYISNILVVKDPAKKENNGKIFLFRYGQQIFDLIQAARTPEVDDDVAFNPYDMFEGANFNLIAKLDKGYRSYKSSKFSKQSQVDADEKKMEEIYNNLYSLNEFIADSKFKTVEELTARFHKVLGNSKRVAPLEPNEPTADAPQQKTKRAPKQKAVSNDDDTPPFATDDEESTSKLALFKQMAED